MSVKSDLLKMIYSKANDKVWGLLFHLVKDTPSTLIDQEITMNNASNKINEMYQTLSQRTVEKSQLVPREKKVVFENKNQLITFLFIVWLDGIHDEYVNLDFVKWLSSPFVKLFIKINVSKIFNPKSLPPLVSDILDLYRGVGIKLEKGTIIKTGVTNWEKIIKENLGGLFDISTDEIKDATTVNLKRVLKNNKYTLNIDQEGNLNAISQLVDKSKYFANGKKKFFIQPGVNIGNILDPGRMMLTGEGILKNKSVLLLRNRLRNNYDLSLYKIQLIFEKKIISTIETTYEKRPFTKNPGEVDFFHIKVNGKDSNVGATKKEALESPGLALGKFMGDFSQSIICAHRAREVDGVRILGTGDGMAGCMFMFYS